MRRARRAPSTRPSRSRGEHSRPLAHSPQYKRAHTMYQRCDVHPRARLQLPFEPCVRRLQSHRLRCRGGGWRAASSKERPRRAQNRLEKDVHRSSGLVSATLARRAPDTSARSVYARDARGRARGAPNPRTRRGRTGAFEHACWDTRHAVACVQRSCTR